MKTLNSGNSHLQENTSGKTRKPSTCNWNSPKLIWSDVPSCLCRIATASIFQVLCLYWIELVETCRNRNKVFGSMERFSVSPMSLSWKALCPLQRIGLRRRLLQGSKAGSWQIEDGGIVGWERSGAGRRVWGGLPGEESRRAAWRTQTKQAGSGRVQHKHEEIVLETVEAGSWYCRCRIDLRCTHTPAQLKRSCRKTQ